MRTVACRLIPGAALAVGLLGCTKPNPLFCGDGNCTDPEHPFCDVDGSMSGIKNNCIAVSCMPGEFAECRGDVALTCNADGNNYDELSCPRGCDPNAHGCRLCDPSQSVCTNGVAQTCDASGNVVASETCALGCFDSEPRCRHVDPSNGLAMYVDMVSSPPDIDVPLLQINPLTGETFDDHGAKLNIPNFLLVAPAAGVPVRLYVVNNLHIADVLPAGANDVATGPAIAFYARGKISVTGNFLAIGFMGGIDLPGCTGGQGTLTDLVTVARSGGGGGGANATDGARGGDVTSFETGGAKGTASGVPFLVPLRGGCPGGTDTGTGGPLIGRGGNGGGAIQLVSEVGIEISGILDVRGEDGSPEDYNQGVGLIISGGGAGGSVLLEAPTVTLAPSAKLLATGGAGGMGCTVPSSTCGLGGVGASIGQAAGGGQAATYNGAVPATGGGGGGGLGRIRMNTASGGYQQGVGALLAGDTTAGNLATR